MADNRNNIRIRWAIAAALTALALFNLGAAVYTWIYGGSTWYFLGAIKVRFHEWDKSWLWAIGAFTAAVIIRPGGFVPAFVFRAVFDPWRFRGPSFVRPWVVLGAATGFGVGMYVSRCWHYLFPTFLYTLPFITVCAAALAAAAGGAAAAFNKILPGQDDRYRQGLLQGLVELLLLAAVYWPLSEWEGFSTDPISPLFIGFVMALVHIWFVGLLQRYRVLAGPRKKIILAGVAAGLITAAAVSQLRYRAQVHGPAPRDRVIFVTLDTTRADHLSSYGYPRRTSPRIDAVAAGGARFALAISPMGITDPSHATMFTGTYPRSHGSLDVSYPITGKVSSLPEYFAERGFATACFTSRFRLDPSRVLNLPGFTDEYVLRGHARRTSAPTAFRRAANWLDRHRGDDVFIWVHFFDPHQTYKPHPDFPIRFTDSKVACEPDTLLKPDQWIAKKEVQRCVDLYDGEIAYMDFWVGRLMDYANNLEPKSERPPLIVLVADHGEVLGEYQDTTLHYGFGHGDMIYHENNWIPLIISWPGHIKPAVVGGVTELVDLAPTLVDYVFDRHDFVGQGHDLRPAMEGRAAPDETGVVSRALRCENNKRYRLEPALGLYRGYDLLLDFKNGATAYTNVLIDPRQTQDLTPFLPSQAAGMVGLLNEWKRVTPETKPENPDLAPSDRDALRALGYIQ